jgi:hypothetical protein
MTVSWERVVFIGDRMIFTVAQKWMSLAEKMHEIYKGVDDI